MCDYVDKKFPTNYIQRTSCHITLFREKSESCTTICTGRPLASPLRVQKPRRHHITQQTPDKCISESNNKAPGTK